MQIKTSLYILLTSAIMLSACTHNKKTENTQIQTVSKTDNSAKTSAEGNVTYLSTSDFRLKIMDYTIHQTEWVFEGERPAVIDFYTTWCGPCKMMAPIVEEMAKAYAGKVDFYKVDIEKEQELAQTFGIQSIPTFLFIPAKGKPTMQMGAMPKETFEKMVDEIRK